jgi:hypothetical protein
MNGMDAVIQIRNGAVKGFSIYADKTWGCAARCPLRASPDAFHSTSKIRKSEVVPVNQGLLCCANLFGAARIFSGLRESFRGCANLFAAARRRPNCTAAGRFPLVPANAGTQSGFPRAREMSERSRDCAKRNPGLTARLAPDFVSLSYACCVAPRLKAATQLWRRAYDGFSIP